MALHGFNDKGWAQYKSDRKFLYGGKRQVHLRKNFERRGKGGGGSATGVSIIGMVMEDVPLATDFATMSGTPSLDWTVTPGQAGPDADYTDEHEDTTGVLVFDWKRNAETKEEYVSDTGVYAAYDTAFEIMTPVVELVAGNRRWAWRKAINRSKTDIRASSDEPIFVSGHEKIINQGGTTYRWFVITDVMDLRAFPGFVAGEKQFPVNQAADGNFAMIEGYTAGNDQSVGRDADGNAEWQDDGACA